jgi:hypothetical protein
VSPCMNEEPRDSDHVGKTRNGNRGTRVSVDELVAKSQTVFERVVPILERAASRIRSRLTRK